MVLRNGAAGLPEVDRNGSPRLVMSMHLLHRLSGQAANPTGTPTKHSGAEQRTEESWNGVLKAPTHHADSSEDEAAETDDSPGVNSERLECPHERLSPREVHRSLCMCGGSNRECHECWSERAYRAFQGFFSSGV